MHISIASVCTETKLKSVQPTIKFSCLWDVKRFVLCLHNIRTAPELRIGTYLRCGRNKVYNCPFMVTMAFFIVHTETTREKNLP